MFDTSQQAELKKYTFVVYILQALSFVLLFTAVIGIIVNYVKEDDVRGTWLESHFRWQKATFWYGLLWMVIGVSTTWFFGIGYVVLGILTLWLIYRIARGWVCLVDGKEMYFYPTGEERE